MYSLSSQYCVTRPLSFSFLFLDKPQVITLSSNQTLDDGRDAFLYCEAVAYPPTITYNWFKDGSAIISDPSGDFIVDRVGLQSRLRVKQLKKDSAGRYSCSGRNTIGTGEQKAVFLKVNCKQCQPLFYSTARKYLTI